MHELGNLSESSADRIDAALARLRHGLAVLAAMSPASARIAKDFDELFGSVPGAAGDPDSAFCAGDEFTIRINCSESKS